MRSDLYTFSARIRSSPQHSERNSPHRGEHTTEHNITPAALLSARLYPICSPLPDRSAQPVIRLGARLLAYLARSPPSSEDADKTFGEMQERIQRRQPMSAGIPQTRSGAQSYA